MDEIDLSHLPQQDETLEEQLSQKDEIPQIRNILHNDIRAAAFLAAALYFLCVVVDFTASGCDNCPTDQTELLFLFPAKCPSNRQQDFGNPIALALR